MEQTAQQSAIRALLTPYLPSVRSHRSESGLVHPGVGLTQEQILTVQKHVRAQTETWKTYFLDMLASESAAFEPPVCLRDPETTAFASKGTNSQFIRDGLTAYTQAVLYIVTGNPRYRANAVTILRLWSKLNPAEFRYFPDAHIHVGIPMNRMCIAAELIRYSDFEPSDGYTKDALHWTDEEIAAFSENLLRPALAAFLSDCSGFMNQHLYTVIGAMSAYLFLDDTDGYAKTVEWFTVNRNAANPGFNGSVRRLFRKITTVDEVGQPEGSGRVLPEPVIQHVEMGRDQAHGCGDLTNAAILARMLLSQNTKVDPVSGTVSSEDDAVGIYEFDDDRILSAADFFFRYMLGYESRWVPVPFSVRDGVIADNYTDYSPNYRGRYRTINFWDLYVYYTYHRKDVNLAEKYPYFTEGFLRKVPSVYYSCGHRVVNWDNVDGGGDFWLFLPEDAAWDANLLARPQVHWRTEAEDRGSMVQNPGAMSVIREDGVGFVRFVRSDAPAVLAMTDSGSDRTAIALRIRTDGTAKLKLSCVRDEILLPDTHGEWKYVICTRAASENFGDFYTIAVSEIAGTYADLDAVDIKPDEPTEGRAAIDLLRFNGGNTVTSVTYRNALLTLAFKASDARAVYACEGLPDGAVFDTSAGVLTWTPDTAGTFTLFVTASLGETCALRKAEITGCPDRGSAMSTVSAGFDPDTPYTRASLAEYRNALDAANHALTSSDAAFAGCLAELGRAVGNLEPLSPVLADDPYTGSTSLDYAKLVRESTMGEEIHNLIDPEGTFCGYYKAVDRAHIMDFGEEYRICVTKFGFRARLGFSDRLAGVQVFGSDDGETWICLTEKEAAYTQEYHEVNVKPELCGSHFRYLKIRKTTEYPDALRGNVHGLLEFGVLRIFGTRHEAD